MNPQHTNDMTKTATILTVGTVVVLLAFFGLMYMSYSNTEVRLRNTIEAQQKTCEAYYDKLWKVLQQKAGVTDQYKGAFKDIYADLIGGRYQDKDLLFKFVVESNPQFDASLYKDLMASIEAERNGFLMEQRRLIDLDREHRTLRQTIPGSFFVGGRPDVKITVVTSERTEAVFTSGQENDIELFKR